MLLLNVNAGVANLQAKDSTCQWLNSESPGGSVQLHHVVNKTDVQGYTGPHCRLCLTILALHCPWDRPNDAT